jgi:hypothetical protein
MMIYNVTDVGLFIYFSYDNNNSYQHISYDFVSKKNTIGFFIKNE